MSDSPISGMWDLAWRAANAIAIQEGKRVDPSFGNNGLQANLARGDREYTLKLLSDCVEHLSKAAGIGAK